MITFFYSLFGWMPPVLQVLVFGVVAIFLVWSILKIVQLILDLIPFF